MTYLCGFLLQVFMRDFFSSGLAFLINGEPDLVKNFLLMAVQLQGTEKRVDCFTLGEGVMPASFKVHPTSKNDISFKQFDMLGNLLGTKHYL